MKERTQKTLSQVNGCPQRDRSETEWYGGVRTFMWMCEDNIVEVPFDKEHLFEQILSPANLNRAYKAVMRNKGCGGIDKWAVAPMALANKDKLCKSKRAAMRVKESITRFIENTLYLKVNKENNGWISRMAPKIRTAVCRTARTVVWEVGEQENRR